MSKPRTQLISIPTPHAFANPWTRETYRLIADFKVDFDRQRGRGASQLLCDSYLLMTSDWLLGCHGEHASWNLLDVHGLLQFYWNLLIEPGRREEMISLLGAFYCYLGNIGRVSPEMHGRMRQLSLDCCVIGLDAALEHHRQETIGRCVTRESFLRRRDPASRC